MYLVSRMKKKLHNRKRTDKKSAKIHCQPTIGFLSYAMRQTRVNYRNSLVTTLIHAG